MSATIQAPRRSNRGGKIGPAELRAQRNLAAHARADGRETHSKERARLEQAARARRERAQARLEHHNAQERRIVGLLRRGAGVTQILEEVSGAQDTPRDSVTRALHLRRVLELVGADSKQAHGVQIKTRKLARTMVFLDRRIAELNNMTPQTLRERRGPDTRRSAKARHDSPSRALGVLAARS
jgi:hypothetical protein